MYHVAYIIFLFGVFNCFAYKLRVGEFESGMGVSIAHVNVRLLLAGFERLQYNISNMHYDIFALPRPDYTEEYRMSKLL